MPTERIPRARAGFALILMAVAAMVAAACSASAIEDDIDDLRRDIAAGRDDAQRTQLIAALEPLEPLRYHEHDFAIRDEGRVPGEALTWAVRGRETLRWVVWPSELDGHVAQYREWLDALIPPLQDNDPATASEPSRLVHALAHNFEVVVETWLDGDAVPEPPALAGLDPPSHAHGAGNDDSGGGHGGHGADDSDDSMQMSSDDDDAGHGDDDSDGSMQMGSDDDDAGHGGDDSDSSMQMGSDDDDADHGDDDSEGSMQMSAGDDDEEHAGHDDH